MLAFFATARAFLSRVPWPVWAALGAALALLALRAWHNSQVTEAATEGHKAGVTQQREETLTTIIERTEQANETREVIQGEVRAGNGAALYDQCVRTARTPENCRRFLPDVQAPDR